MTFDRPPLETPRLRLRCPVASDIKAIVAAVGVREVARNLARVPHPYTDADAQFFLDEIVPNEWTWAITRRGDDTMIGSVGLTPEAGADSAELGYWLAKPVWGQGIATEAARAVLAYGFDVLALPVITSGYFLHNPASGRVLAKLGFAETGEIDRPCVAEGGELRAKVMELRAGGSGQPLRAT